MRPPFGRLSFWIKPVIAALLVALGDAFFHGGHIGSTLGIFALALVVGVATAHPAVRRDPRARWGLALAAFFSLVLFDAPGCLAWALLWTALALAVLSPRAGPNLDAASWFWPLIYLAVAGTIAPVADLWRLNRLFGVSLGVFGRVLAVVAIPIIGGAVFLILFASANPVIDHYLNGVRLPAFDIPRLLLWFFLLVGAWSFLRPRFLHMTRQPPAAMDDRPIAGIGVLSVGLSLGVFNALFALQNGLDLAFLWSGAALPAGVTLADYARRGAYPLIATALLAGAFVLVALRPGSATARQPWLRGLVVLWVAQNVFLVASSIHRTFDYIEAFSLTRLRIAALLWMGLVAIGLVSICYRMLRAKTSRWLIDVNVLAAALVLAGSSLVDFSAIAARWNVGHAREIGGGGPALDLCYLASVSPSSILEPLGDLERRPLSAAFRDRVSWVRSEALNHVEAGQADWRSWTWRNQRRLDRARAFYEVQPTASALWRGSRSCDGTPEPLVIRPADRPEPLTEASPG
jgi:hypothetical protein